MRARAARGRLALALASLAAVCPPAAQAQADIFAPSLERPPTTVLPSCVTGGATEACSDFESGTPHGWQLAVWSAGSRGYVRGAVDLVSDPRSGRGSSLQIRADFEPLGWSAIALELRADVSLADYAGVVAEVLAPRDTTLHLSARFAIVAGPVWDWIETTEAIPLAPGQWSLVGAPLAADAWRGPRDSAVADELEWVSYLNDIHRIVLRIEADPDGTRRGTGDRAFLYIDNIRFPVRGSRWPVGMTAR